VPAAAPPDGTFDPGSFRDPASRVFHRGDDVYRLLSDGAAEDWASLASTRFFKEWTEAGRIVGTRPVHENGRLLLAHDPIPVWTYPYEWSFSMLKAAALLQLDLLDAALDEGMTVKDATPYNIQFVGTSPVFVDVGSFRRYEQGEPWLGYGQFCRQFLFPLMLRAHAGIDFQPLLRGSLDGVSPSAARAVLRGARVWKPGVMMDVVLQARADAALAGSRRDVRQELGSAGFTPDMIKANTSRLRKVLAGTNWDPAASTWSDYAGCGHVATQRAIKERFVAAVAGRKRRSLVWDLGANDGFFSKLVAVGAGSVVALDSDELVIDRLFRDLAANGPANVVPIVFDLSDPSPGLGWRGRERRTLEERARPDLVLVLAVVHHLVISGNLPLAEVVDWLRSLDAEIVFEWVPPDDPMAMQLAVNKRAGEIHPDYREDELRRLLEGRFEVAADEPLENRRLFHLVPA
jgi:ribosomal protein L11 methylase PrmA